MKFQFVVIKVPEFVCRDIDQMRVTADVMAATLRRIEKDVMEATGGKNASYHTMLTMTDLLGALLTEVKVGLEDRIAIPVEPSPGNPNLN